MMAFIENGLKRLAAKYAIWSETKIEVISKLKIFHSDWPQRLLAFILKLSKCCQQTERKTHEALLSGFNQCLVTGIFRGVLFCSQNPTVI